MYGSRYGQLALELRDHARISTRMIVWPYVVLYPNSGRLFAVGLVEFSHKVVGAYPPLHGLVVQSFDFPL